MQIRRDAYLRALTDRMHNGMIKVVTGLRRSGKTYLLFNIFADWLRSEGVADDRIIEVALDTDGAAALRDPAVLGEYLRGRIADKKSQYYVLLDEVQYAISALELRGGEPPRLYGVLNGLLRMGNVDVFVTGSNSKLLSSDVLTEFRGRGDEVRVRPLSFAEFMQTFDGTPAEGWAEYVVFGGMPLVAGMPTEEQKMRYLERLFAETHLADIVSRNHLSRARGLEGIVDVLASCTGSLVSPHRIARTFDSELGEKVSANTVLKYIDCLEEAFVIEQSKRFDVRGRRYIASPSKYYFTDVGLRNARLGFRQIDEGHLMENVLFNELRMRGFIVDTGVVESRSRVDGRERRRQLEVDFVCNLGSRRCYIQSALHADEERIEEREKAPFERIADSFEKILLVRDVVRPTRDERGIITMSLYDFLLDPDVLS